MKRLILLCITLTMLIMPAIGQEKANATDADGTMYIIPVNSDGTLPTWKTQARMTPGARLI